MQGEADLFSLALSNANDIGTDNAADPRMQKAIPGWFKRVIPAPAFALFPLVTNKRLTATICVDHEKAGRMIADGQLNYLRILRNQVVMALKQKASPASNI